MADPMKSVLQDVRKMSRAIRLRGEDDPEKVAEVLRVILSEAIALKASGSDTLGKGAINEVRAIRRDLVTGKISPKGGTGKYIAKYSLVLDQIADTESLTKKRLKDDGLGLGSSIMNNLPSADTIAAAMITANPIAGYSAKMILDMTRNQRRARQQSREEHTARLENLKREAVEIEEEIKLTESKLEALGADESNLLEVEKLEELKEDLGNKLDLIYEEVHLLNEAWKSPPIEVESEDLERIADSEEYAARLERERANAARLLERESEVESTLTDNFKDGARDEVTEGKPFSELLVGLASGLGGFLGGIIPKLLAPFTKVIGFFISGASMLVRLGPIAVLMASVKGIYDFVDGFLSAAKFLGQSDSETTFLDRMKVGVSSLISGLLAPIDWILDFFDLGFMDSQEEMTKTIIGGFDKVYDGLLKFFNDPVDMIINFFEGGGFDRMISSISNFLNEAVPKITSTLMDAGQKILSILTLPMRNVMAFIDNIDFERLFGYIGDKLGNPIQKVIDIFDSIDGASMLLGVSKSLESALGSIFDLITRPSRQVIDYVKNFDVSEFVNQIKESIDSVFDDILGIFKNISESVTGWFDERIEAMKESWLGRGVSSISSIFGSNKESSNLTEDINSVSRAGLVEDSSDAQNSSVFSRAYDGFSNWFRGNDQSGGGNTVIAPTSNTVVNNSTNFESSTGARNNDRTWRNTNVRGLGLGNR